MKLYLKNVGKVHSASVEIKGITVIAGENNTGKSTVGKALFAVFNSFYHIEKKIVSERIDSISNQLFLMYRNQPNQILWDFDISELANDIVKNAVNARAKKENVNKSIFETIAHYDEKLVTVVDETEIADGVERIAALLNVSEDDIFKRVLQRRLDAEFNQQINNVYTDDESIIRLDIQNEQIDIRISNNEVSNVDKKIDLGTEVIYIDDPFVLDEVPARVFRTNTPYTDHRTHLKQKLHFSRRDLNLVEEIVTDSKLDCIYSKVSSVCEGDVVRDKRAALGYRIPGSDKLLDVKNLSTGLKTFAILKKLLVAGYIEYNGTIILDEPEIHLHPEWQLLFAELIVLLHREFGLHVLLNTHSPYFLNAIEVYAAKYDVSSNCKYYLTKDIGNAAVVEDVSSNIEKIYSKLARPLQYLENIYQCD